MAKILGLDLGTNSIGWAIIDSKNKKIIKIGTRIFPEGVENLGQGEGREQSKNTTRTAARSTRRQYFRRKIRKQELMAILKKHGMCPTEKEELSDWFRLPPYQLRFDGLRQEITLLEFGRVLYHLAQRRGFQSNSRSAAANEDSTIYETKGSLTGINETRNLINTSKENTLGAALFSEIVKPYEPGKIPARRRRTERKMYVQEFEAFWKSQEKYHQILTPELKEKIGGRKRDGDKTDGVLFFQRPLKSQKSKVGKCSFERTKTKIPMSHPLFEKARAWQFINTIECDGAPLLSFERRKVFELLLKKERVKFKDIRKALNKLDGEFNFNYQEIDAFPGCPTIYKLTHKKCFGQDWFEFSEKEQEDIWHVFYSFDDKEKLQEYAQRKWNFDKKRAEYAVSKVFLKEGYGSLSRKALNNIFPFLSKDGNGFNYDVAVALGGIKNAFGKLWEDLEMDEKESIEKECVSIMKEKNVGGFIEPLKNFLSDNFNFSEFQFKKLYHHSANIHAQDIIKRLPTGADADREIGKIRNPIVIQALFELRKLVNQLLSEYGKFDQIKIELARDLKINKSQRKKIRDGNRHRENYHKDIEKELRRIKQRPNHESILRYKLWEECEKVCPYSGKEISLKQLFDGSFEIEHIWPYSRSLDDSYLNKTLCEAVINEEKGNRTPFEYFSAVGGFEKFKERVQKVFFDTKKFPNRYKKFKRMMSEKLDDNFISRQLNDTRYISKEAKNYLQKICEDVRVASGQMTAKLRHHWGLNNIISHDNELKNREDHRHHAIDALVMACFTEKHLNEISKWNRYNRTYDLKDFPEPMPDFRYHAINAVNQILVSHKKSNRVMTTRTYRIKKDGKVFANKGGAARGQLHKETVYGKRQSPQREKPSFHVRKPLDWFKKKDQLQKIVDDRLRNLIINQLEERGQFKKDGTILGGAFFEKNEETGRLMTKFFLPNKSGNPIPIYKVRIRAESSTNQQLKTEINQWVTPRNNHHVLIYKDLEGNLQEKVVTLWEAVKKRRNGEKVFELPKDGAEIITIMEKNDLFLLNLSMEEIDFKNLNYSILSQHLYRVQKFSPGDYSFRHHLASKLDHKDDLVLIKSFKKWQQVNPIKVRIDAIGNLKLV